MTLKVILASGANFSNAVDAWSLSSLSSLADSRHRGGGAQLGGDLGGRRLPIGDRVSWWR
jgi:hypothetical protein